jgi:hypothetical protein
MITTPAVSGEPGQTPDRIRHDRIDKAGSVTLRSGGGACTASASRPLSRAGLSGADGYGTLWSLYRRPRAALVELAMLLEQPRDTGGQLRAIGQVARALVPACSV